MEYLKDAKGRRQHVFGLFSPSRNFRLQARSDDDARAWVELIKSEARIDGNQQDAHAGNLVSHGENPEQLNIQRLDHERLGSSSPEPFEVLPRHSTTTRDGIRIPSIRRLSAHELEYSGDELAHYSDFSDAPPQSYSQSTSLGAVLNKSPYAPQQVSGTGRNASQMSGFNIEPDERVVWHGHLLCLKTKGGVRQWKKLWVVLRPKNLGFYKNNEAGFLTSQ